LAGGAVWPSDLQETAEYAFLALFAADQRASVFVFAQSALAAVSLAGTLIHGPTFSVAALTTTVQCHRLVLNRSLTDRCLCRG